MRLHLLDLSVNYVVQIRYKARGEDGLEDLASALQDKVSALAVTVKVFLFKPCVNAMWGPKRCPLQSNAMWGR